MPQQSHSNNSSSNNVKKKKKGRAPAHQNTFAFKHNPKSKKTAAILEAPIEGVCRRCHDKLEWRKRYRKYKPLSQPSKCNLCEKRNVLAAYHTICVSCAQSSPKAVQFLHEWKVKRQQKQQDASALNEEKQKVDDESNLASASTVSPDNHFVATRVCAICVTEPALFSENDQNEDDGNAQPLDRPLRLRERKALERERERERAAASNKRKDNNRNDDNNNEDEDEEDDDKHDDHKEQVDNENDNIIDDQVNKLAIYNEDDDDDDETQDPFLQAVGGADKLLTGEAYQQKLLLEQQQQQQQTWIQLIINNWFTDTYRNEVKFNICLFH